MCTNMLNKRFSQTQFRIRLFVFIFVSTRAFDWLLLKPDNIYDIVAHINDPGNDSADRTVLTQSEESRVKACIKWTDFEIQRELERFEANRNICINHHTYLKEVDSFVIEVGGNKGEDATMMINLYNPRYVILEPVQVYADILKEKFKSNSRVTVLNFGLGKKNENAYINVRPNNPEAISNLAENYHVEVKLKEATEFFTSIRVGKFDIDLLMLDCHGCELDVLENIVESNLVIHFKNIQFKTQGNFSSVHNTSANQKERYCKLQERLSRTHKPTFQYKHIYENWRRNNIQYQYQTI